jgi:ectoine hydroxylase-related dioxygenase (phytanoyl-CoA dioxygenase family)
MPGAVWIPLDDVDEENGTLSILPDWHTKGKLPRLIDKGDKPLFKEEIAAKVLPEDIDQRTVTYRLKAGQMATHHTMLPHCSTPNRSDRWRRHIGIRYVAADGQLGEKVYKDFRTLKPFNREFFLVRGKDVQGYGLKHSPFE